MAVSRKNMWKRRILKDLHELGGTVGGLIAVTWNPDFSICLQNNKAGNSRTACNGGREMGKRVLTDWLARTSLHFPLLLRRCDL